MLTQKGEICNLKIVGCPWAYLCLCSKLKNRAETGSKGLPKHNEYTSLIKLE